MTENEKLAYIAGMMDGDGSFSLCRRTNPKGKNYLFFPYIQFGSLKKEMISDLKEKWGGSIVFRPDRIGKDGIKRNPFYWWRLEKNGKCQPFLEAIIPYLEIKKERALFLLNYIKRNPFKRGSNPLSLEVLASRENDYLRMQEFNNEKTFGRNAVKATKCISQDSLFWAYFAGLLDTDGSFSIKKEKNNRYVAQVLLTQTDIRGINKIRKNCPFGSLFLVKAKSTKLGRCYRFGVYRKEEMELMLPYLIPFLHTKKKQAEEILKFCQEKKTITHRRGGTPIEELNFREECYQNVCNLNKYGVYKPSLIDLEAREGDRAEGESHRERLSEMDSKEYATV